MSRVRKSAQKIKKFVWRIAIYIRLSKEESEDMRRSKGKNQRTSHGSNKGDCITSKRSNP